MASEQNVNITVDPFMFGKGVDDAQAVYDALESTYKSTSENIASMTDVQTLALAATGTKAVVSLLTKHPILGVPATLGQASTAVAVLGEAAESGNIQPSQILGLASGIIGIASSFAVMATLGTGVVLAGIGGATFGPLALGLGLSLAAIGKALDYFQDDISKALGDAYDQVVKQVSDAGEFLSKIAEDLGSKFQGFYQGLQEKFDGASDTSSPLILDLNGDGVSTTSVSSGAHFDHNADNRAEATGWIAGADGLLVWDRNENGVIDNGKELFGDQMVLVGGARASNGFEALKELDSNGDGVFSSSDSLFSKVGVWIDSNSNGISEASEIHKLYDVGVASINVDYKVSSNLDAGGNDHRQLGSYTKVDGSVLAIDDVWFATNFVDSVEKDPVIINEYIAGLPNVKGLGFAHDLHQAMALDSSGGLALLVDKFYSDSTTSGSMSVVDDIVFSWTGSANIDPGSRGGFFDARKLSSIEFFLGEKFFQKYGDNASTNNPALNSAVVLEEMYSSLKSYVADALILQKKDYLKIISDVSVGFGVDGAAFNVDSAVSEVQKIYEKNPDEAYDFLTVLYHALGASGRSGELLVDGFRSAGSRDGNGFDFLVATADQWVFGSAKSELISSGNKDVVFDGGGGGGDTVKGDGGNDVFIYNGGYGYLEIDNSYLVGNVPILKFGPGITGASLTVTTTPSGNSLIITDGIEGDQIVLDYSLLNSNYGVKKVQFSDGSSLAFEDLVEMKDQLLELKNSTGTLGNDTLNGSARAQTFDGKGGQDVIHGGGGNDTFIYNAGYGYLEIDNAYAAGEVPILKFGTGITAASLTVTTTPSGNSLIITDGIEGDQIVLDYSLLNSNYGVKKVQFSDGSSLAFEDLVTMKDQLLEIKNSTGTFGNDTLNGSARAQTFDGKGGQDVIHGGGGNDTFIYNAGYGYLEIDNAYAAGEVPILKFGTGITAASLTVTTTPSGNSLIITDGIEGDQVVLDYSLLNSNYGVKKVQFSDGSSLAFEDLVTMKDQLLELKNSTGTLGNDTLNGSARAQTFDGKGGQDVIHGGGGNDTFIYKAGYGYLEIDNAYAAGEVPILKFGIGITAASLTVTTTPSGNSLIITDGIEGDQVVLDYSLLYPNYGVKKAEFSDGSSLAFEDLVTMKDQLLEIKNSTGTLGNDTLNGSARAQTFDGKGGQDVIHGGGGNDTFIFNAGYGYLEIDNAYSAGEAPILKFGVGITAASLTVTTTPSGNSLIITDGIEGDQVVLDYSLLYPNNGVKQIQFSDGSNMTDSQLIDLIGINSHENVVDHVS
ncbi:calcium-binding protein [Pseudomonas savastanoi]|uniref:calcium-binding protein n=1 Tax=Pseudomonas savastanoi TaxID=29438 RepID=UPI000E30E822|nr:calcium-binding protein [Pseudomonas savastanoi]